MDDLESLFGSDLGDLEHDASSHFMEDSHVTSSSSHASDVHPLPTPSCGDGSQNGHQVSHNATISVVLPSKTPSQTLCEAQDEDDDLARELMEAMEAQENMSSDQADTEPCDRCQVLPDDMNTPAETNHGNLQLQLQLTIPAAPSSRARPLNGESSQPPPSPSQPPASSLKVSSTIASSDEVNSTPRILPPFPGQEQVPPKKARISEKSNPPSFSPMDVKTNDLIDLSEFSEDVRPQTWVTSRVDLCHDASCLKPFIKFCKSPSVSALQVVSDKLYSQEMYSPPYKQSQDISG